MSTTAGASNSFFGCHPDQTFPCYRTELECSMEMTDATTNNAIVRLLIRSNGIPDHNSWGMSGPDATIEETNHIFRIPRVPVLTDITEAVELPLGPIGYAVNGVPIFSPYNNVCCDATFQELSSMDFCIGHPAQGNYHYHYFAKNTEGYDKCLMSCSAGEVSAIFGVAKEQS